MKLLTTFCLLGALVLSGLSASAQASMPGDHKTQVTYRDGAARKNGKMVKFKNGKETALTSTYTAENGARVSPDGTVTYPGGRKEKLSEGYAINKQGNKVILADDMIAPTAILDHQQKITGKTGTTVTLTEKTRTTINEETGRKAVKDTIRTRNMK